MPSAHQSPVPFDVGAAMAAQLPGSVVVGREGDDSSTFLFSPCVRDAMNRCLTTLALPAAGATCTT
ncbi:hypothetical protein GCM10018790_63520 [Kitasatospora xanthocidica]|uniref:alpha/beta hydrolase n=1 Tax=Kitasatospora xanthocidica TaxID=83382 RepID=UPI001994FE2D|nr:alpha/beta hydrolase [Kitasatospora xanthocidica]GHF76731.1 hypothetical protein GCM10018790_63520 [Kitasatospora xanthocidica]